jgi:hypothetical protein
MDVNEEYQRIGKKLYAAAKFAINLLCTGEKMSTEVYRLSEENGIPVGTLKRAMRVVKVKSRKRGHNWFMSLPEGAMERFERLICPRKVAHTKEPQHGCPTNGAISTDWTLVAVDNGKVAKIEIPEYKRSKPGLRMKVGSYEFEVDEDFPAEKLAALLLAVGGERSC